MNPITQFLKDSGDAFGLVFGRLTTIGRPFTKRSQRGVARYHIACRCDCGKKKSAIDLRKLTSGKTLSCGCLNKERRIEASRHSHKITNGASQAINRGDARGRVWTSMIQRCHNPNHRAYSHYGGRGIIVCDRWRGVDGFFNFIADMGDRPSSQHSLGRIDNDRPYSPNNCRWETWTQQHRNRRDNRLVTVGDQTKSVAEWAEIYGVLPGRIYYRLDAGWPEDLAVLTPCQVT